MFFIVLSLVAAWSLYVAVVVMARLRMVRRDASVNIGSVKASVIALQARAHNLQQVIASCLYLSRLFSFSTSQAQSFCWMAASGTA
ncbi:MAG TPA: hypothetical protein VGR50_04585 [Terriglobales bacterium]|nr:hypothetical protein [Terriglobales bacterium]